MALELVTHSVTCGMSPMKMLSERCHSDNDNGVLAPVNDCMLSGSTRWSALQLTVAASWARMLSG